MNSWLSTAVMDEARRQAELIAAIFSPQAPDAACAGMRQEGTRWQTGLAAYRGNGLAHARNALRVQFPTLFAMLGSDAFAALCARYWRAHPPRRGDLAWVGEELAEFIPAVTTLDDWPWLSDCARLDWALWQISSAASSRLTEADLRRLVDEDPGRLSLKLSASTRRLASAWPIATIYDAHHQKNPDWQVVRNALTQARAETAWIWRPYGDPAAAAAMKTLDVATDRWILALGAGQSIECALDTAGFEFDFPAWLEDAVKQGWVECIQVL